MVVAGCKLDKPGSTLRTFTKQTDDTLTEAVQKYSLKVDKIGGKVVVKGWQLCDEKLVSLPSDFRCFPLDGTFPPRASNLFWFSRYCCSQTEALDGISRKERGRGITVSSLCDRMSCISSREPTSLITIFSVGLLRNSYISN